MDPRSRGEMPLAFDLAGMDAAQKTHHRELKRRVFVADIVSMRSIT